jgi:single-strand DNA-binding protein
MLGVNKVILIGNATCDAELRHTQTGKPVSSIRLATNRSVKGEEETQFHSVVCWDRLAETTAEYVKKGAPLYVEGRLQYRSFQDDEGKECGVCEIVTDHVPLLARRANGPRGEPAISPAVSRCPAIRTIPRPHRRRAGVRPHPPRAATPAPGSADPAPPR